MEVEVRLHVERYETYVLLVIKYFVNVHIIYITMEIQFQLEALGSSSFYFLLFILIYILFDIPKHSSVVIIRELLISRSPPC